MQQRAQTCCKQHLPPTPTLARELGRVVTGSIPRGVPSAEFGFETCYRAWQGIHTLAASLALPSITRRSLNVPLRPKQPYPLVIFIGRPLFSLDARTMLRLPYRVLLNRAVSHAYRLHPTGGERYWPWTAGGSTGSKLAPDMGLPPCFGFQHP